jgi:hypothetical protein
MPVEVIANHANPKDVLERKAAGCRSKPPELTPWIFFARRILYKQQQRVIVKVPTD